MRPRRSHVGRTGPGRRAVLLAGILLATAGVFLPWISIDASAPLPVVGDLLAALGVVPDEDPVAGWEIPWIAWRASEDPFLRTSLAMAELISGRPDRAAARALFGDRYEERYAFLALAPVLLALAHVILLRRRSPRMARLLAGFDAALVLAGLWALARIPGPSEPVGLEVRAGIPVTLLALLLLGAAAGIRSRRR